MKAKLSFILFILALCCSVSAQVLEKSHNELRPEYARSYKLKVTDKYIYRYTLIEDQAFVNRVNIQTHAIESSKMIKVSGGKCFPFGGDDKFFILATKYTHKRYDLILKSYDYDSFKELSSETIGSIQSDKDESIRKITYSPDSSLIMCYFMTYSDKNVYYHHVIVFDRFGKQKKMFSFKPKFSFPYYQLNGFVINNDGEIAISYLSCDASEKEKATKFIIDVNLLGEDGDDVENIAYNVEPGEGIYFGNKIMKNGDLITCYSQRIKNFTSLKYRDYEFPSGGKDVSFIVADRISLNKRESVWHTENGKIFEIDPSIWAREKSIVDQSECGTPLLGNILEMANGDVCFSGMSLKDEGYSTKYKTRLYWFSSIYHLFITAEGNYLSTQKTYRPFFNPFEYDCNYYLCYAYGNDVYTFYSYPLYLLNNEERPRVLTVEKQTALMSHRINADGDEEIVNLTGTEKPAERAFYDAVRLSDTQFLLRTNVKNKWWYESLKIPEIDLSAIKPRISAAKTKSTSATKADAKKTETTIKPATPANPRGRKVKK